MEVVELLVYIILVFVLLSLIGVMSWLLYDYNNLKTKLTGDFQTINNTFSSHKTKDNTLEDDINSNSSNIINTSNYVDLNALNSSNYISDVKTNLSSDLTQSALNTSNYIGVIEDRADNVDTNFSTFHNNLNKYFTFGTIGEDINGADNKIYNYIFQDDLTDNDKRLKLMYETTIASELTIGGGAKLNTNSDKKLKVCNIEGDSCFDIYKNEKNLIIKTHDSDGKIIIGGGTPDNSLVIESGDLKFKGNSVYHAGNSHTHTGGGSVTTDAAASATTEQTSVFADAASALIGGM